MNIEWVINKAKEKFYPITHAEAVLFGDNNKTVEEEINNINATYIKSLSASGKTVTYTKGNGTTGTIITQDTTYSNATTSTAGLMSPDDKTVLNNLKNDINNISTSVDNVQTQIDDLTGNIQQNNLIANISSSLSSNVSENITILSKDYRAFIIVLCNGDEFDHTVINTYTWLSSMVNGYYRLELYDPSNNVYIGYIEFQTNSIYVYLNKYDEYYVDIYGLISL